MAITNLLSYAGVPLPLPNQEMIDWVAYNIPLDQNIVLTWRSWPGPGLLGLTVPTGFYQVPKIRLNQLLWWNGATRFPYGHFLCDATSLKQIQALTNGNNCTTFTPQPLQMADSIGGIIQPKMYLIRSQPLTGLRGVNGAYVITLVAKSYFWHSVPCPQFNVTPETTWDNMYAAIQTAIGQAISRDAVNPNYLSPSPKFNDYAYKNLPLVFDAIAYNCGQRVLFGLDGKIRVYNYSSSASALANNLEAANLLRKAGDNGLGAKL